MTQPDKVEVRTDDGVAPAWIHRPERPGEFPGVIFYPDAGSVRPAMHEMAGRLAELGYVVLLPHIFYRAGDYAPFDVATVFSVPSERERLMAIVRAHDTKSAMRDAASYLRTLHAQRGVRRGPVASMGYCIGGRLAFTTAVTYPKDIAAAASIHGGGIATDAPDSPHREADKVEARLYFAISDNDGSCTPEQQGMLVTALAKAHVRFTVDHFRAAHGFAVSDIPVYDKEAAETHWRRIEELFAVAFA
ncbi:Dienelactone hydrolase [Minicystis rosea]|nr:Dienelactone hydrolase [Minicystis rosea]